LKFRCDFTAFATVPSEYAGNTIPSNVDVNVGANLFKTDCVACHGESGHGDGPASQALDPRPANLVDLNKISADDFLFWKLVQVLLGRQCPLGKAYLPINKFGR